MRGFKSRLIALAVLIWADALSSLVLQTIHTNGAYLFVCVNFSLLALLIILKNKPTAIMVDISLLMFGQMIVHALAWYIWTYFTFPYFYHGAIKLIVIITYLRLIWIGKNDGNILQLPHWLLFCRDYNLVSLFSAKVQR